MIKTNKLVAAIIGAVVSMGLAGFACIHGAGALSTLEVKYNQKYSTREGNLVIKDDMIPTDAILNANKMGIYYACYNYKNPTSTAHPEWAGYSVTFSGSTATAFDCYAKDKGKETNLVFDGENWGNSYAIGVNYGESTKEIERSYTGADDYIKIVSPNAATDVQTGDTYDVHMILSNIRVRTYVCDEKVGGDGSTTVVSIAYGWGNNMNDGYGAGGSKGDHRGISYLTGKSLEKKSRCRGGAIFYVKIELHDHATGEKINGKKMIWAVNDLDIGDRMHSREGVNEYSSTYEYAEHIKFLKDANENIRGAVDEIIDGKELKTYVSMVDILDGGTHDRCKYSVRGEQELIMNADNVIYHNIYVNGNENHCINQSSESGATDDNSTSALFLVDTTDFIFEWGGSKCGTTIDSAPYSKFVGMTEVSYNGSQTYNGSAISASNPITVNSATSAPIIFNHYIKREMGVSTDEQEPYKVIKNDWRGSETVTGSKQYTSVTDHEYKLVYSTTSYSGESGGYKATLEPGESKTYRHELQYRFSNVNNSSYASAGERAITLKRPQATFNGSVIPSVKNGGTNATITDGKVRITAPDGEYSVSFVNTIGRDNDTAGDTVGSDWRTWVMKKVDGQNTRAAGDHTGKANRTEGDSKSSDIQAYTITGNLRYGEEILYCGYMNYTTVVKKGNNSTSTINGCVTVYRDNARCEFDSSFEYGVNYATNTGRIGVQNKSLANNPTYTTPYTNMSVSIFARPTDNIRFTYDMCAGVLYPVQKRSLNTTITYKATGESTKLNAQNNGYLFRDSVSVVDGTFYNPRFWTNQNDGHNYGFLRTRVEDGFWSPNNAVNKNYRCGSDTETGHYQIAGKEDCGRSGVYDIGVIDAGSTITQKLEWNEQTYRYNDGRNTFANSPRAASASVVIPYNYILKPFVTNESANVGKVAYIGESLTMTPGVVTTARKNTAFPSSKQTYATITKPTEIKVKYYFKTSSGSVISESEVTSSSRSQYRLNKNGLINGTVTTEDKKSVDDGGTLLPSVKVQIPNTGVGVGDKVCVEVSVSPADSHDARDASSVNSGGDGGEALRETTNGSSWATSVSCSTIAKKPSMSVESSNAYSATEFKTANYARTIGSKKFNFGSWSEYGVFGRVLTEQSSLFASGAAYGYSRDGYTASAAQAANVSRANDDASATGNKVSTTTNSSKCTFMTQTFANANCNSSSTSIGGVMASQYEQRIKERFSSNSGSFEIVGLATKQYNNATYYNVSGYSGSDVIVAPSGIVRFDSKYNLYINALPNITNEQFAAKGIERPNHTIVYSAPDKNIVIDGDLGYNGGNIAGADSITQVIIIAKNVYFTSAPTYINAVIIANEVNTCRFVGANKVAVGGKGSAGTIDSTQCNQALRFDAPVIVKKLILNRTFGAGNGDDAIRRAEIFNFNMANYLWSFNQMTRLSQATTTYSRELPTRY